MAPLKKPLVGKWLSECMDFGDGQKIRIYSEVTAERQTIQAALNYAESGCAGSYNLTDTLGVPVEAPVPEFAVALVDVAGIPEDFYVLQVTALDDVSQISYVLLHITDTAFHELFGFVSALPTWEEWTALPDVAGFVSDPAGFVAAGGGGVMHFNAVSSLP